MKRWNEKKLEQELEELLQDVPEQEELEKKIEQKIKKKIQRVVYRTLVGVAGIILALLIVINPFLNAVFVNPAKLNEGEQSQIFQTLKNYWETTRPYVDLVTLNVKKKGFARYELEMQISNQRDPVMYGVPNVWMDMVCGKYKFREDKELLMTFYLSRFENPYETKEEYLEKIRELPESSVLYLSVGEKNPKSVEELRNASVDAIWAEIYQPNSEFQGGLSLRDSVVGGTQTARTEMTEKQLQEEYVSHLKDLLDHIELWNSFDLPSGSKIFPGDNKENVLRACYEDAKELEMLQTKNYCISGKRDEIAAYLEAADVVSLRVDEVKLSELY